MIACDRDIEGEFGWRWEVEELEGVEEGGGMLSRNETSQRRKREREKNNGVGATTPPPLLLLLPLPLSPELAGAFCWLRELLPQI